MSEAEAGTIPILTDEGYPGLGSASNVSARTDLRSGAAIFECAGKHDAQGAM